MQGNFPNRLIFKEKTSNTQQNVITRPNLYLKSRESNILVNDSLHGCFMINNNAEGHEKFVSVNNKKIKEFCKYEKTPCLSEDDKFFFSNCTEKNITMNKILEKSIELIRDIREKIGTNYYSDGRGYIDLKIFDRLDKFIFDVNNWLHNNDVVCIVWLEERKVKIFAPPFKISVVLLSDGRVELDPSVISDDKSEQYEYTMPEKSFKLYGKMIDFFYDTIVAGRFVNLTLYALLENINNNSSEIEK